VQYVLLTSSYGKRGSTDSRYRCHLQREWMCTGIPCSPWSESM